MVNEEEALRQIVSQLEAAWNNSDSIAFAAPFSDDADFVHILGGHFTGRASIEHGHRTIFDTIYKGSTVQLTVEKIRFAGSEVSIVFIFSTLTLVTPGMPPQINARPTMILHRQAGNWKIVAFQNTVVTPEGSAHGNDPIAEKHPFKGSAKASEH